MDQNDPCPPAGFDIARHYVNHLSRWRLAFAWTFGVVLDYAVLLALVLVIYSVVAVLQSLGALAAEPISPACVSLPYDVGERPTCVELRR